MSNDDHLRISDNERIDALSALTRHFTEGRLDDAEFNTRSDTITTAITRGDIRAVFTDLPGGFPFTTDTHGNLVALDNSRSHLVREEEQAQAELVALRRKGRIMNNVNSMVGVVTLGGFFLLHFLLGLPYAWLIFIFAPMLAVGVQRVLRFNNEEQETYKRLQSMEQRDRARRVEKAVARLHELEAREEQGKS